MSALRRVVFALAIVSVALATAAWADPPARVGRLSYLNGAVSLKAANAVEWAPATLNYPLTSGNSLWASDHSRAEIKIGSTALRLDHNTALDLLTLDDSVLQFQVSQGAVNARVPRIDQGEVVEIFAPGTRISLLRPGWYRIDVGRQDSTTRISVFQGEAQLAAGGSVFTVHEGASAQLAGAAITSDVADGARDEFDRWSMARDQRPERSASARYVSPEMTGYEDLDEYGNWRNMSGYGPLWYPGSVPDGWAPYRFGHWDWVNPWGWTWIDDAPWGFAPFHFGRWLFIHGRWAWSPGFFVARPVFAPALVVFIGGERSRLLVSSGNAPVIAWFPLAPGEIFVPAFRCSTAFIRSINAAHVNIVNLNITNIRVDSMKFVNRSLPGAVTVVTRQTFVSAAPVVKSLVAAPANLIAQAPVSGMTAPVAPVLKRITVPQRDTAIGAAPSRPAVISRSVVPVVDPPAPSATPGTPQPISAARSAPPVDPRARAPQFRQGSARESRSAREELLRPATRTVAPQPNADTRIPVAAPAHQAGPAAPSQAQDIARPTRPREGHGARFRAGEPEAGATSRNAGTLSTNPVPRERAIGHSLRGRLGDR